MRVDTIRPPGLRRIIFAALMLAVAAGASCVSRQQPSSDARPFVDELGRAVMVPAQPRRIISLAPSITETLFALGLEDRLIGVTSYCDYPPAATLKEVIGDTMRPSLEKIIALKPDLIIASTASQLEQFIFKLDEMGIPVYISNPRNIESVLASIMKIGELAGASERANEVTQKLRSRVEAVQERVKERRRPGVFFILGTQPLITAGGDSFINDLITRAGGRSISENEKSEYPQYSLETVMASRPEVIFLQSGDPELPDRLKQTPAALSGRVYQLDDNLIIRPGPRIVDGLEQMAARIHPEAAESGFVPGPLSVVSCWERIAVP